MPAAPANFGAQHRHQLSLLGERSSYLEAFADLLLLILVLVQAWAL